MQMKRFFAILESRLGLKFPPNGSQQPNLGVEKGGSVIFESLPGNHTHQSQTYSSPAPEDVADDTYLQDVLVHYSLETKQLLNDWEQEERLIALGGDHSVSYISLSAVLERFGEENVAVVMFDSHGDLHLPETSPSGNFHGMWLRAFLDKFPGYTQENSLIQPEQLRFVGNLILEDEEERLIKSRGVKTYPSSAANRENAAELLNWAKNYQHLHISFDVDVFDEKLMSATGTRNPHGFTLPEVKVFLEKLLEHPSYSMDVVEFNPEKSGAEAGLKLIHQVLQLLGDDFTSTK